MNGTRVELHTVDLAILFVYALSMVALIPVRDVRADCMTPTNVSPIVRVLVALKEEVKLAIEINEPVWIVHPPQARSRRSAKPQKRGPLVQRGSPKFSRMPNACNTDVRKSL